MNEPFKLPRGTVRAAITGLLCVVSSIMLFVPVVNDQAGSMFLMLTALAVRDYFATRTAQNEADGEPLAEPSVG